MSLSSEAFVGVWGTLTLAQLAMFIPYWRRWRAYRSKVADKIRAHNARNGYGQGMGKAELATAYINPFQSRALEEFAATNGMTARSYRQELRKNIGRRLLPPGGVLFQGIAVAYVLSIPVCAGKLELMSGDRLLFGAGFLLLIGILLYPFT